MNDCCATSSRDKPAVSQPATLASFAVRPGVTFPDWSSVTSPVVKNALQAMVGSDHVLNRWSGYDPATDSVRVALLRLYADHGRAPTMGALAGRTGLSEMAIRPLLDELRRRDLVVLDGERIVGAYPFSDHNTGHRVTLDGRTLNAMCAVDALGIGALTDSDIAIASQCRHCGAPIRITTRDRGRALADVEPQSAIMWQSVRYEGGCAASSLCATTAFFCSDEHLSAWRDERSADEPGFRLSIEEGLEAGRALFGPSLAGLDVASKSPVVANRPLRANGRNGSAYDLVVIGAGSAGFSASITAADQGAQVALIGSGTIGGTCVNVGCVPSKTLIRAAETLHNARVAARFAGIAAAAELIDWRGTVRQKDALVSELRQAKYVDLLPAYNGIAYRDGPARLLDGGVEVDGARIAAGKIIIASGARPAVPSIPGIETVPYLTSTTALDVEELPRSLLVIGGGYIGAELAQMFARAGVQVTLVCRSHLLPEAEPEISAALTGYFEDEGITVISGIAYRAIRKTEGGASLTVTRDGQDVQIDADQVLITTGRTPNIEGLGLAEHGIAVSPKGGIVVDDRMRTTRADVYAAGDVTGRDQFVYMAAYGAKLATKNALNGDSLRYDNSAMPAIVFTDPQVASVGLTEAAARAGGHAVRVSTIGLDQVPRALAARDTRGLIKLVADAGRGRLLGAHVFAPEGADSIQTAALAIRQGLTVDDLTETIFPYLTTVEGLKLAALSFGKDVAKLSCCAG
ncbi:bifunctional organomercurial lyase/mercury(II) reductase MerBA [Rhizobium leguminosarum]|uniref:bifunctional organomercurial lyase/mercury(II) reductase MerBA n=1 Tax=Rhizobium leguminosarum TaxID=384 RepID=UPI0014423D6E|nr:bifunctional organomercurial lyase/mercury(II) reductase MerBA [Rhizobium leguminosarum]MBY5840637.1 bifunctional organomercurial lyase/mercury(II) reductase MerBA [Rhizobium leguminosarum]NKM80046.1 bifunctional organomercurial lyase/mercury(II) reductase MerBA [Rhizobium leguminosarum bv. viciae]QSZ06207.1 bifunctional organomercurial lyase/mercury(II) reductase MerBA [Rhizobium leguminosarum]